MILSVDINNKKNIKNVSQYDMNNNIKIITDVENTNSNTTNSNPLSNGAKNNNINSKSKTISMNNNKFKINHIII